ncbi:hypothetical protein Gogos_006079 [Gossypium gossypioides]|uniref:DUF4283 domain-containing protein n=1 Tax=Gossypium gossypioides TaxID=34282 RepID=A0A7J9C4P5_GOSGO|nr:hypothetical protein [Gossypium gossypioides]
MVGKIAKLDFNTDSKARGKYARMAVYVNLGKPLLSQVLINGNIQRIEYESLPVVCFSCGRRQPRESRKLRKNTPGEDFSGSRFKALTQIEEEDDDTALEKERSTISKNKGKKILGNLAQEDLVIKKCLPQWRLSSGKSWHL